MITLPRASGHELAERRYGVVVQSGALGRLSTVVVAPTSTSAGSSIFRPEIELGGRRTAVMTDQLRALDRRKIGRRVGRLAAGDLRAVDDALELVLGLL